MWEVYLGDSKRLVSLSFRLDIAADQQPDLRTLAVILELYSRLNERSEAFILDGTMMPMPILRTVVNPNFPFLISMNRRTTPLPRLDGIAQENQLTPHLYLTLLRLVQSSQLGVDEVQCLIRHHLVCPPRVHLVLWVDHVLIDLDETRQSKIRVRLLDYLSRLLPIYRNA